MDITKMERLLLESLSRENVYIDVGQSVTPDRINCADTCQSTENTGENCYYALSCFRHARI